MKKLLVISSAPAVLINGKPFLDIKFCEGMRYYCDAWDGPVTSILRAQETPFPFGQSYDRTELPFELRLISDGSSVDRSIVEEFDVVLCGGDS